MTRSKPSCVGSRRGVLGTCRRRFELFLPHVHQSMSVTTFIQGTPLLVISIVTRSFEQSLCGWVIFTKCTYVLCFSLCRFGNPLTHVSNPCITSCAGSNVFECQHFYYSMWVMALARCTFFPVSILIQPYLFIARLSMGTNQKGVSRQGHHPCTHYECF